MFKPGEKLVCISNKYEERRLILNKIYTFKECDRIKDRILDNNIILEESNIIWRKDRFISLKEYRKQKLQKICSK